MRVFAYLAMLFVGVAVFSTGKVHAEANKNNQTGKKHSRVVTVKHGDTLSKIADKQKSTYQRIFYANEQVKDPDLIYSGEKLRIPAKNEKLKARPMNGVTSKPSGHSAYSYSRNNNVGSAPKSTRTYSVSGGVWDRIASCESGGNWSINTGNGYYGGLQFTASSWRAAGGKGLPNQASKSEQIARAKILQSRQGWGAWPACTAKLGIR